MTWLLTPLAGQDTENEQVRVQGERLLLELSRYGATADIYDATFQLQVPDTFYTKSGFLNPNYAIRAPTRRQDYLGDSEFEGPAVEPKVSTRKVTQTRKSAAKAVHDRDDSDSDPTSDLSLPPANPVVKRRKLHPDARRRSSPPSNTTVSNSDDDYNESLATQGTTKSAKPAKPVKSKPETPERPEGYDQMTSKQKMAATKQANKEKASRESKLQEQELPEHGTERVARRR